MLDYPASELLGKKVETILPIASRIFYQTHLLPVLRLTGTFSEAFFSFEDRNKKILPVLWNASSEIIEGNQVYIFAGILQVNREKYEQELIDGRKAAEQALAADPALAAARLEANHYRDELALQARLNDQKSFDLEHFNRVLGHDIREPVRKILIFSGMLRDFSKAPSSYTEEQLRGKIRQSAELLGHLADNLHTIATFENTHPVPEDVMLSGAIARAIEQINVSYPDKDFSISLNGSLTAWVDPAQIQSLFFLLIVYAVENRKTYSSALSIRLDKVNEPEVGPSGKTSRFRRAGRVRLTIADAEQGEMVARYFNELFIRLKAGSQESFQLSMVRKIIERNKGRILLEMIPESGVVLTLFMPVREEE